MKKFNNIIKKHDIDNKYNLLKDKDVKKDIADIKNVYKSLG